MIRKDGKRKLRKKEGLTKKEHKFVREYLKDFNGTRAYLASFPMYESSCKHNSAGASACNLLKKHSIMVEVDNNITTMMSNLELTNEAILGQQAILAFMDTRSLFNEDGTFKEIKELNIAQQAVIESIEIDELFSGSGEQRVQIGNRKKVRFYSKQKAIDNLMKYKKLIGDGGTNINLNNKQEISLTIASERLKEKLGADGITELADKLQATG